MFKFLSAVIVAVSVLAPPVWSGEIRQATLSGEALEQSGALVVDIREQAEWRETGVVPGALLVTFRDPDSFLAAIAPNLAEGQPIALICRSGRRSAAAAEAIAARTDHPVIDLAGGVSRLVGEGYALSPCGSC